ncbi:MAG: WYL domain-containing protein [Gemmatimonadales bacterium]
MTDTSAERFRNLLAILPHFARRQTIPVEELSGLTGVPVVELIGLLQVLVERYDDPAGFQEEVHINIDRNEITVRTDHFLRPMRLTAAECCALELGLALVEPVDGDSRVVALKQKLANLITKLPQDRSYARLSGGRSGSLANPGDGSVMTAIRNGMQQLRVTRILYQGATASAPASRDVHGYRITFSNGAWFLSAWCERTNEFRNFRVDRIVEAAITDRSYTIRRDVDLDRYTINGTPFLPNGRPEPLRLRYAATIARWIDERDGLGLEPDGSAIRDHPLADQEWALRHILQYGPDVEVLGPESVRELLIERLGEMVGGNQLSS